MNLETFWYITPILVSATVALAGLVNGMFNLSGIWAQLVAWLFGAILSVTSWGLGLIEFESPVWLWLVGMSVVVGLSSNGIYDIPTIKKWVDSWFGRETKIGLIQELRSKNGSLRDEIYSLNQSNISNTAKVNKLTRDCELLAKGIATKDSEIDVLKQKLSRPKPKKTDKK